MGFETTFGELPPLTRKNPFEERRRSPDEEMTMPKCGVCGAEVEEQPKITEKGTCSVCGAKLAIKK